MLTNSLKHVVNILRYKKLHNDRVAGICSSFYKYVSISTYVQFVRLLILFQTTISADVEIRLIH